MVDKEAEFNSYIENAPDPAPELEGDVKEKEEQKSDVKIDDVPNSSGEKEESGEEVVKKLMEDAGLREKEDEEKDEEGTDIPDAFTNACLEQGWSEDEIREFAAGLDDAALLELIPELTGQIDSEQKEVSAKQEDKSKATEKESAEKKEVDNEEIAALKKELADIKAEIGKNKEEKSVKESEAMFQTISQAFDEASKEFEIFGKTDELLKYPAGPRKGQFVPTSPAMVARKEVVAKAAPFISEGVAVEEAMDIALTWYKGRYLEKDVERNIIKGLKKHEKKLSAKRSGKETVRVYENEEERKAEVVREARRKAGIKEEI
jgi:hypothetical protein